MRRVVLRGTVRVALPPDEALALFTAEGERSWVPGWDPTYPAGGDDREVGTVFVTGETTWIVITRRRSGCATRAFCRASASARSR